MDFELHFTKEHEEFRREVCEFIDANALKTPLSHADTVMPPIDLYEKGRDLQRKTAAKGWFAPGYPKEYGGGGLEAEYRNILAQEFGRVREQRRWVLETQVSRIMTAGLMAYGSEEQKQQLLTPLLQAEWIGWQCFTEPDAGSDEAAMKSTAVRDGDVFIINGDKVFVGETPVHPNFLYWPAVTDPSAPRHENLSAFFIPADLPGIHYQTMDLFTSVTGQKWQVTCQDVRCPADRLIGPENKGWQVIQATLTAEHGGGVAGGIDMPRYRIVLKLIDYCKKTMRNGQPLSKDPMVQDILVQLYAEHHRLRLWELSSRGYIPRNYSANQRSLIGKLLNPRLGKALLDILGPYGLIDDPDLQLLAGEIEYYVRHGDCTHHGGTPEIQKIMIARGLGLGRGAAKAVKK